MSALKNPLMYRAEDEEYASRVNQIEANFQESVSIPSWLENTESPFKWLKSLKIRLTIIVHGILTEKLLDYKNQGPDYGFEKFALLLTLVCMELFEQDDDADDSENESEDEDSTLVLEKDSSSEDEKIDPEKSYVHLEAVLEEMRCNEGDVMYTRIGPALEHVLIATRANMLHMMGRDEESVQIAKNLVPLDSMSVENKAGFEAIRAKFIVHMYQDMTVALKAIDKSIKLDPDFAYWKYLAAKIMRRHRRFLNLEMAPEELEYFEQAVALERNPKFLVFLAQAKQEVALDIRSGHSGVSSQDPGELLATAVQLFRECWQLKNDSAPIARRVGNGIMKMKNENFDFQLAKEALHKAVELSPNHVTYHALGKLYLYYAHDEEKALKYFESIKGMYGTGELIRYKLINDPESDISEHIQYWTEIADSQVKRAIYYKDIGWYYLCIKRNIFKAVNFFWLILKEDFNSFRVLNFTSYAFVVKGPLNMLEILVNEVLLALERYSKIPETAKGCEKLNDFLEKIFEKHPDLRKITPDPELLPNIKNSVLKELAKLKRRMYGRTNSEVEGRNTRGNWRPRGQENVKGNTVENWRNECNKPEESGNSQSASNRTRLSSGEYGETSREMDKFSRRRTDSEHEEQNQNGGRHRRWNDRYEAYNQRNLEDARPDAAQSRNEPRERRQSYNSRYDTTVTNWRTENRR